MYKQRVPYLAHDVPDISIVHGVARHCPRISVENIHQVALLAVLQHQVQLVHLSSLRMHLCTCSTQANVSILQYVY